MIFDSSFLYRSNAPALECSRGRSSVFWRLRDTTLIPPAEARKL